MEKHPFFHPVQEFKAKLLVRKNMATVFWGNIGVLLVYVLDFGDAVTALCYCVTLEMLWQAFCHKKPGWCANCNAMPPSPTWTCDQVMMLYLRDCGPCLTHS